MRNLFDRRTKINSHLWIDNKCQTSAFVYHRRHRHMELVCEETDYREDHQAGEERSPDVADCHD